MQTIARITRLSDFAALDAEWQALHAAASGGIFVHHAFLLSWAETFGAGCPLDVTLLRQDGQLVAALPMFRTRKERACAVMGEGRAGIAQWLVHPDLPDREAALAELLRPPALSFYRFEPVETPDADLLEAAARRAGLVVWRKATMRAAQAASDSGFDGYLAQLKPKSRQVFRRGERKLEALGVTDLRADRDGDAALEAFLGASRRSWKGLSGTGFGASAEGEAFLRTLSRRLGSEVCRFAARVIGDEPVSGRFVLSHGGKHIGMANDFNEDYAQLAAGRNSMMHSIRDAFADGAVAFDFTRSSEFMDELGNSFRPLERLLIHRPIDPALSVFMAGQAARKLKRKASRWKKGRRGVVA